MDSERIQIRVDRINPPLLPSPVSAGDGKRRALKLFECRINRRVPDERVRGHRRAARGSNARIRCTGAAGLNAISVQRPISRVVLLVLVLLWLLGTLRAFALWSHDPLYAYANSYDQTRYTCLLYTSDAADE